MIQVAQRAEDLAGPRASTPTCSGPGRSRRTTRRGWCSSTVGGLRLLLDRGAPSALHYLGVDDLDADGRPAARRPGWTVESEPHVIFGHDDDTLGPGRDRRVDGLRPRLRGQPGRPRGAAAAGLSARGATCARPPRQRRLAPSQCGHEGAGRAAPGGRAPGRERRAGRAHAGGLPRGARRRAPRGSSATSGSPPTATWSASTTATCAVRPARAGWSRRWSWPSSTSSSSRPGRTRGPTSTTRRPTATSELDRVLTLRKLLETVADYDRRVELAIETKHPTRYGGLVERRLVEHAAPLRLAPTGQPGAGDELLLDRAAAGAAAGAGRAAGDADREGPALADAPAGRGARLDPRPGHRRAHRAPRVRAPAARRPAARSTSGPSTPTRSWSCAWTWG